MFDLVFKKRVEQKTRAVGLLGFFVSEIFRKYWNGLKFFVIGIKRDICAECFVVFSRRW